jgi:hypothetical protein
MAVRVEGGEVLRPESVAGADVVVAAEEELTYVVEGGASLPDVDEEVGQVSWVLVAPAGEPPPDVRGLARATAKIRVPRGKVARHARAHLEGVSPDRVRSVRMDALSPAPGEVSLVPRSLAAGGTPASTDVRPILVRAVGVRGTKHADAVRAFVSYLTAGAGRPAFAACGEGATR